MRRGQPKLIVDRLEEIERKRYESIVAKCHPPIFELAELWKEQIEGLKALGPSPPPELVAELEACIERRLTMIHRKYSGPTPPEPNRFAAQIIFSNKALTSKKDELGILEGLHWERFKTPLIQDIQGMQARDGRAARRVLQTGRDYEALRCDHKKPKPFKGNLEHWNMFEVLWGLGIENLTPLEMADFFDSYCPCNADHDPDALKQLRARFCEALSRATDSR